MTAHRIRTLVTAVFGVAVAGFAAVTVKDQDWSLLAGLTEPRAVLLLGAAFVANGAGLWLGMLAWRALLAGLGSPTGRWEGARIFFVGFLAKFVPGRVWTLVANIRMGTSAGITPARMAAAYVLCVVVGSLTGLTIAAAAVPGGSGPYGAWPVAAALPVVACLIRPGLVHRAAAAAARLLRRPAPPARASDRGIRLSITAQTLSWAVSGLHLWFLAVAAGASPLPALPVCVGAFGVAVVAGNFAVLLPDGIGVREAVLLAALTTVLPMPAAGAVVLLSRLACTLSEITVAGAALLVARLRARPGGSHGPGSSDSEKGKQSWLISTSRSSSTTTPPTSAA